MSLSSLAAACTAQAHIDTPLGGVLLARTETGLAGAWFEGQKAHPGPMAAPDRPTDPLLREAATQLAEYFAGRRRQFDLPLDLRGTEFQRQVWDQLLRIPSGETRSYAEIARNINQPKAVRAVARANGDNFRGIVIPCHRVIGSDGSLTGYGGGLARKQWLLDHERKMAKP